MKKLSILILASVLILLSVPHVFAQALTISPTPTPTPIPTSVDYDLPYPGLLPGNPLYDIKVLRDRIESFFISDPLKRAEFSLLQSDKRLSAGVMLFDEGQYDRAESTISKGEKYMQDSLNQATALKEKGQTADPLLQKINLSSQKHVEVIKNLEKKASLDISKRLDVSLNMAEETSKKAKEESLK